MKRKSITPPTKLKVKSNAIAEYGAGIKHKMENSNNKTLYSKGKK